MSSQKSEAQSRPFIGALLRLASQVMTERFSRWIAASGFEGVQPAHSAAIQPLWEQPEGARITTLARSSRMTKQSMSALVSDLERWGYVERAADPDDARATRIRLTARGRAYARAARAFAREVESEWSRHVGTSRMNDLCATLELLRNEVFLTEE